MVDDDAMVVIIDVVVGICQHTHYRIEDVRCEEINNVSSVTDSGRVVTKVVGIGLTQKILLLAGSDAAYRDLLEGPCGQYLSYRSHVAETGESYHKRKPSHVK